MIKKLLAVWLVSCKAIYMFCQDKNYKVFLFHSVAAAAPAAAAKEEKKEEKKKEESEEEDDDMGFGLFD